MQRIPLWRRGGTIAGYALVDDEDFQRYAENRWHLFRGYAARTLASGEKILMHRQVLEATAGDGTECHHRNGDRLDNRRRNLKVTTKATHQFEHGGRGLSGFRGVYREKKRWRAQVKSKGRKHNLGCYDTPQEASEVVEAWWAQQRQEPPESGPCA